MTQAADRLTRELGQRLRDLRLRQNIDQIDLAARAGVALNAVKRLESGRGGTTRSLIRIVKALGREDWLAALAPQVSISPLQMLDRKMPPQRASRRRR